MDYPSQRDAILAHAQAAALAVDAQWKDVSVGMPQPRGDRSVRVFYGGEVPPEHMGPDHDSLNSEMVAEVVKVIAFWEVATGSETEALAIDDEMYAFKHQFRTRVLGNARLGGEAENLTVDYADPTFIKLVSGQRYATLAMDVIVDYTEYSKVP